MSVMTEKKLDHLHWPLVLCTVVICALGVWNLASATKNAVNPMWLAQSKWMLLGIIAVGPFLFVLIPVALVMKQPDLGTATVTFFIAMTMIVFAKVRWQSLTALFAGGIAGAVFAWERLLKPYQKTRIVTFLDPQAYAKGAG